MRSILLALIAAASTASAQSQPFQVQPPAPMASQLRPLPGTAPPEPAIVRFRADSPRCGAEEQRVLLREEPFPIGVTRAPPAGSRIELRFRIDASGRPLGIVQERSTIPGYSVQDVPSAFAAWRFAPGGERRDCTIVFSPVVEAVARAAPETLYRFLALHPLSGHMRASEVGRPAFERAKPAGTTCFDPRPSVRMLAFPAFEEIEQPAGTVHFSWLAHDIGPDGRVRNVRLLGSSGNDELDRRSRAAISRSRFQPGARTGCVFEYHRRAVEPMPAPPPPEEESFRAAGATCPQEEPQWLHMPPLDFPAAFNRRSIEGWAIVSYDLAPWGETGNVRVLAAEPAAVFGDQAARIVREARTAGGDSGFVGCTARVIFLMPRDRSDSAD